jgi:hypothetical protein
MKKLLLGLCILLVASGSQAQSSEDSNLKGTKQFIIAPSITGDDAAKSCVVKKEDIDTAVRFVLHQSKIQYNEKKFDWAKPVVILHANLVFLYDTSIKACIYAYSIEVDTSVTVNNTGQKGMASIWSRSGVGMGPQANSKSQAVGSIEKAIKQLVVAWSAVNPE